MDIRERNEHEKVARQRFDDWSESNTFERLRPWLKYVQTHLLAEIDWRETRRVLDVACGSGWLVLKAAKRFLPTEVEGRVLACGCDLSEGMLRQRASERQKRDNTSFLAASAQTLPFADGSFDALMCTAAFHHFPLPDQALLEFKRVLRPGGVLLISDTCRDQSIGNWIWDRLHRWFERGHVKYYRINELLKLLGDAGFAAVSVRELNPTYEEVRKMVRKTALFRASSPSM